ncbi:cyclophilin-like fold protein [Acidovorax sp. sic0104]|uniref:cyclophilin-like fold protein n=1 Tax=Acidovorax sp. sic0104 TaxID=2854784 RepID=UPI001216E683|nr:cyclophilin-like fold protein [Acidovorax sp. sic0104]MBV7543517.1 hypothetical protein [Acidovorax sp. sic0104]RZJ62611.1 MAG: hypothetical protein EON49_01625 [Acidovorax sp.]
MKIEFLRDGAVIATAMLYDNATSNDFASLLPLRLTLEDYEGTEKIASLPRTLTTDGAPAACLPVAGDLCFYAPWGNLAIFYRDGQLSTGLIRLGRLQAGCESAQFLGDFTGHVVVAVAQDCV